MYTTTNIWSINEKIKSISRCSNILIDLDSAKKTEVINQCGELIKDTVLACAENKFGTISTSNLENKCHFFGQDFIDTMICIIERNGKYRTTIAKYTFGILMDAFSKVKNDVCDDFIIDTSFCRLCIVDKSRGGNAVYSAYIPYSDSVFDKYEDGEILTIGKILKLLTMELRRVKVMIDETNNWYYTKLMSVYKEIIDKIEDILFNEEYSVPEFVLDKNNPASPNTIYGRIEISFA